MSKKKYLLLFLFLIMVAPARGQSASESMLSGRVLDPSGAAIVAAEIRVQNRNGSAITTKTGNNGEFSLRLPLEGQTVSVTAEGFADSSQVVLPADGRFQDLQIVLEVAGYKGSVTVTDALDAAAAVSSATRTLTPILNVPQSITVVSQEVIHEQAMQSIADVVRYVPGVTAIQGENNRDQLVIRGNSSSADFFVDGVRDDVQYYRDLYNLERLEALKGPNAMIFGRGGGGGVINRVTKHAGFTALRELTFQGGSFANKRVTTDLNQPLGQKIGVRFNGLYENSGSFRRHVGLERIGLNPTVTLLAGKSTQIRIGFEHFRDRRVADRGVPSFHNKPLDIARSTFFGDPEQSRVRANVNILSGLFEHQAGSLNIRNRTLFGDYHRFYQNFVPGAVNATRTLAGLSAYNNATHRRNFFNQTDLDYELRAGSTRHLLLGGLEVGRQVSDNFRNTGFFNNSSTTILVPLSAPSVSVPVTFRQSATDAYNRVQANIVAAYVQDQIELPHKFQALLGIRFDRFNLEFLNHRNQDRLQRVDHLVSPRAGLVFKPTAAMSLYGSYSVSFLPSSGDQFSSLTAVTQTLKPEMFSNYELGAKWSIRPALSLTAAMYRLDRTNTKATAPNDPTRIVQTGSQRTNGFELGASGSINRQWTMIAAYAYQSAKVTSATAAAPKGNHVAQVPQNTFSVWNNYRFMKRLGAGLGLIYRSSMFAAIDNRVVLPGYFRADAAMYYSLSERISLQVNLENALDRRFFVNADSNDNISPGAPRSIRAGLRWKF